MMTFDPTYQINKFYQQQRFLLLSLLFIDFLLSVMLSDSQPLCLWKICIWLFALFLPVADCWLTIPPFSSQVFISSYFLPVPKTSRSCN